MGRLISCKRDFVVMSSGTSKFLQSGSCKLKFMPVRSKSEGLQIQMACRLVKSDALNSGVLETAPDSVIQTRAVNRELLAEYEGKNIARIDIRSCYWNIALREGIISLETYLRFHDQKLPRNLAIGNLAKELKASIYVDGVMNDIQTFESETKRINKLIRYHTYRLYLECQKVTGNRIIMLKTDELFAPVECSSGIIRHISSQKLKVSAGIIYIDKVSQRYFKYTSYESGKQETVRI